MYNKKILIIICLFSVQIIYSQSNTFSFSTSGNLFEKIDNLEMPINNAIIKIENSGLMTKTNSSGYFNILVNNYNGKTFKLLIFHYNYMPIVIEKELINNKMYELGNIELLSNSSYNFRRKRTEPYDSSDVIIKGHVKNKMSNDPIAFADVYIENSNHYIKTNQNGEYIFNLSGDDFKLLNKPIMIIANSLCHTASTTYYQNESSNTDLYLNRLIQSESIFELNNEMKLLNKQVEEVKFSIKSIYQTQNNVEQSKDLNQLIETQNSLLVLINKQDKKSDLVNGNYTKIQKSIDSLLSVYYQEMLSMQKENDRKKSEEFAFHQEQLNKFSENNKNILTNIKTYLDERLPRPPKPSNSDTTLCLSIFYNNNFTGVGQNLNSYKFPWNIGIQIINFVRYYQINLIYYAVEKDNSKHNLLSLDFGRQIINVLNKPSTKIFLGACIVRWDFGEDIYIDPGLFLSAQLNVNLLKNISLVANFRCNEIIILSNDKYSKSFDIFSALIGLKYCFN